MRQSQPRLAQPRLAQRLLALALLLGSGMVPLWAMEGLGVVTKDVLEEQTLRRAAEGEVLHAPPTSHIGAPKVEGHLAPATPAPIAPEPTVDLGGTVPPAPEGAPFDAPPMEGEGGVPSAPVEAAAAKPKPKTFAEQVAENKKNIRDIRDKKNAEIRQQNAKIIEENKKSRFKKPLIAEILEEEPKITGLAAEKKVTTGTKATPGRSMIDELLAKTEKRRLAEAEADKAKAEANKAQRLAEGLPAEEDVVPGTKSEPVLEPKSTPALATPSDVTLEPQGISPAPDTGGIPEAPPMDIPAPPPMAPPRVEPMPATPPKPAAKIAVKVASPTPEAGAPPAISVSAITGVKLKTPTPRAAVQPEVKPLSEFEQRIQDKLARAKAAEEAKTGQKTAKQLQEEKDAAEFEEPPESAEAKAVREEKEAKIQAEKEKKAAEAETKIQEAKIQAEKEKKAAEVARADAKAVRDAELKAAQPKIEPAAEPKEDLQAVLLKGLQRQRSAKAGEGKAAKEAREATRLSKITTTPQLTVGRLPSSRFEIKIPVRTAPRDISVEPRTPEVKGAAPVGVEAVTEEATTARRIAEEKEAAATREAEIAQRKAAEEKAAEDQRRIAAEEKAMMEAEDKPTAVVTEPTETAAPLKKSPAPEVLPHPGQVDTEAIAAKAEQQRLAEAEAQAETKPVAVETAAELVQNKKISPKQRWTEEAKLLQPSKKITRAAAIRTRKTIEKDLQTAEEEVKKAETQFNAARAKDSAKSVYAKSALQETKETFARWRDAQLLRDNLKANLLIAEKVEASSSNRAQRIGRSVEKWWAENVTKKIQGRRLSQQEARQAKKAIAAVQEAAKATEVLQTDTEAVAAAQARLEADKTALTQVKGKAAEEAKILKVQQDETKLEDATRKKTVSQKAADDAKKLENKETQGFARLIQRAQRRFAQLRGTKTVKATETVNP